MKKIAIKGSTNHEEQKEIIEILKSLGGENKHNFIGDMYWAYYYIDSYNIIDTTCDMDNLKGYILLTLEQYKEKYKHMENKEIQIIPPEGYEIDKENSTFEKIVFKKVEEKLTYEKISNELFTGKKYYYTNGHGTIKESADPEKVTDFCDTDPNNAPTEHQLQRLLALNKFLNVAYYLNEGSEFNWKDHSEYKYFIYYNNNKKIFQIDSNTFVNYGIVYFKSKELAQQAIEILGEETIKLALGVL